MGVYLYSKLPSAYQEVEYIQSSGTQYIDTGFIPSNNTRVELSMGGFSGTSSAHAVFGARASWNTDASIGRGFGMSVNASVSPKDYGGMFGRRYNYSDGMNVFDWADGGSYKLALDQSGFYQDDIKKYTPNTVTFVSPVSLYIFALNDNGSLAEKTPYKLYYFKIWDNGTLVRKFIPCYRKSDSVIGLYDLVNNTFYTNAGTGTFAKGADVDGSHEHELKNAYIGGRLPSTYQEVEYIQSSGTQYIDSLYNPNNNTKIACKFAHNEHTIDTPVFGCRTSNSRNSYTLWSHPSEYGTAGACLFNSTQSSNFTNYAQGTVIEFEYNKSGWKYASQSGTWSPSSGTPNVNMIILGLRSGTSVDSRRFSGKLWYFKIWESGTLMRDLVPCYRKSDSVIGLYDLVNDVFYTNSGTGTFTKGADV